MHKKSLGFVFLFCFALLLIHGFQSPLYAVEDPGHLLISGGYGYSMPLADLSDMIESGMPFNASLRYVTNDGNSFGLSYTKGEYDGKEGSDTTFTMEKVLLQYGFLHHWSGTDLSFQYGLGYINFETDDNFKDGAIMFGASLGVDFYLTDWLSVGPKIDLSYFQGVELGYYWIGDPQSGGYLQSYPREYKTNFLVDIFLVFTVHLF